MAPSPAGSCWTPITRATATGAALLGAAALLPPARAPISTAAVAALTAAAAFATDEPAAAVVDATPTTLRRRTLLRLPLLAPPLAVGVTGLTLLHLFGPHDIDGTAPLSLVTWALLTFTSATCARARTGTPGEPVAIGAAVAIMTLGLWNPLHRWVPVLPVDNASGHTTTRAFVVSIPALLVTLAIATAERRWRRPPSRRRGKRQPPDTRLSTH